MTKAIKNLAKKMRPTVTFFGGEQTEKESEEYKMATVLAMTLASRGVLIRHGGEKGIVQAVMEGAAAGASKYKKKSPKNHAFRPEGIVTPTLTADPLCELIKARDYFARMKMLMGSDVLVFFPGEIETISEFFVAMNLITTKKKIRCIKTPQKVFVYNTMYDQIREAVDRLIAAKQLDPKMFVCFRQASHVFATLEASKMI